ncbi:MAG: hypothetical protein Q9217_005792 [Psora testacea]
MRVGVNWRQIFQTGSPGDVFKIPPGLANMTCDQSGFCKRNRAYADAVSASTTPSPYQINPETIVFSQGQFNAIVDKLLTDGTIVRLPLTVSFLSSGLSRVTLDEERRQKGDIELRHESKARKERFNEAPDWAIVGGLDIDESAHLSEQQEPGSTSVQYGEDKRNKAVIQQNPFRIEFGRDDQVQMIFNERGFMNLEHWRPKTDQADDEGSEKEDQSTWWEESFGGNTDSKPKGPESLGLDITFSGYEHVYGIPEHTGPLSLRETRGGSDEAFTEPYRLYNTDVFEYELNSPMTLYGAIPLMHAHKQDSTVGVLWLSAAETWVDIVKAKRNGRTKRDTQTHWVSESGILDIFVFLGPKPADLTKAMGDLTGNSQLPAQFSIAYHQCRWNYMSDDEVKEVIAKFDKSAIPVDVIWLDLEYTDDRKYFTWDPDKFQNPIEMHERLDLQHRKTVVLIDPHIKNTQDYSVIQSLKEKVLAIRNKNNQTFEGWCWPGSSHWIDCFNPQGRAWWSSLFKLDYFKGSTHNTYVWNDMNEPSVFNGPEITMPKDNLHYGDWEHRDIHNINGMTFVNATYHALLERNPKKPTRPFVLTRSFYVGSQRLGAMWTGDNLADWAHLKESIPMILSLNIAGFPNSGADVGGFFGTPSSELLTRWFQAGAFYPFFRAHAHLDTRRREPYVAGSPYREIMTRAIRLRYQLLPAWYTAFHEASTDSAPILRPQYYVFPNDEAGFDIDDQFYFASTGLLIKPITSEGATSTHIYIADEEIYYDYFDNVIYSKPGKYRIETPLDKIPVLAQGGHIVPRKDRPRRSSSLMKYDPFTLVVFIGRDGSAGGSLYVDDGETFDYQSGAYIRSKFLFDSESSTLSSQDITVKGSMTKAYHKAMADVRIERVIFIGAPSKWQGKTSVTSEQDSKKHESQLTFRESVGGKAAWAVIKDPKVTITKDWKISLA